MLCYIFLISCLTHFSIVPVDLKVIPSPSIIAQLENNLIRLTSHSKMEDVLPSPSREFVHPTSVVTARLLELRKLQEDLKKEAQQPPRIKEAPAKPTGIEDVREKIRSRQFTEAEVILRKMNLIDKIPEIVHEVLNNCSSTVDLLIDFGSELTEIDLSFGVLFSLWDEIKTNDNRNVFKMIALVNAIELRLVVLNGSNEWMNKAEAVTNEILPEIKNFSVAILNTAMISDNYQNSSQVKLLANSIFELGWKHEIWNEVIGKVISESFPVVPAVKMAQNLYSHKFLSQIIVGLLELFKKLDEANNLNNPAVLNIGEYLKHLKEMSNYANLKNEMKNEVDMMIKRMPLCARNVFFEPFVCIWNRGKSEYLYVAGSEYNRNEDKRSVFTRINGDVVGPGVWIVEKSGDDFFFRSKAYDNEYLFATSGTHDKDNRFVHTWTEGGKVGNKSSWKIDLDGDDCYLRNANYDEFLFASDRQSGDKSRYAFTWIPMTFSNREPNFQWQIRSCDLSEILKKGV